MFLFVVVCSLFGNNGDWLNDFEKARSIAKENNKMILVNFSGSDWCAPCIKMKKQVFDTPEFQAYADKTLVLVRADFPRHKKNQLDQAQITHNEKLAEKYNPKGKFPLTLLVDGDGNVVHEWDGFQNMSASDFVNEVSATINGK